jgi:hypothetical protein
MPPPSGAPQGPRQPPHALHASEVTCYQRCPREHQYAYGARRVPLVRSEALTRGTSVHRWLNEFWRATFSGGLLDTYLPADPIARACCLGYAAYYGRPHLDVKAVEHPFTCIVGGVECAGTLDVLAGSDHFDTIIEHKTTSSDISPGSAYWQQVSTTNVQVSMYAAAFLGAKVLYDVIRKPSLRKLRAGKPNEETDDELVARCLAAMSEEPARYFQRAVIVRLEHEHEAFARDLYMVDSLRRLPDQPRNPSSCMAFGRRCGYWPVCWDGESIDDDSKFTENLHGLPAVEVSE